MSILANEIHQLEAELAGRPPIPTDVMQSVVKEEIERAFRIANKHKGAPKSSKLLAYRRALRRLVKIATP